MARFQTNFTSIDMLDASQADLAPQGHASTKQDEGDAKAAATTAAGGDGAVGATDSVPTGSVDDVISWVGEDADRAALALEAENSKPSPRKTLVAALNEVVGD